MISKPKNFQDHIRARGGMIEMYEHIHRLPYIDTVTLSREHDYQLKLNIPKNSASCIQTNTFYYSTIKTLNE